MTKQTTRSTGQSRSATPDVETCDAIVIGANMAGLATSYFLSSWGYSVRLIEKAPFYGSIDRSFRNKNGRSFDFGLHALDYMRNEFVTRFMTRLLDGELHRHERRRGIVHRNHLVPYNAPKDEWPEELRRMLPEGELVDDLGTDPPSRENLARYYGSEFADLIFDETLGSYPAEIRHVGLGVDESRLMANIYPWYFPRAERTPVDLNVSRTYHDRKRAGDPEFFMYPKKGGFGGFADAFVRKIGEQGGEITLGASDLRVEFNSETRRVDWVEAGGRRYASERVYWCAASSLLCELIGKQAPDLRSENFVLGSLEFERPIRCEFTELLFGDPEHLIDRASFPAKFSLEEDNLVQLEFAFPFGSSDYDTKEAYWLEKWLASLQRLGIVEPGNPVVDFDLKVVPMLYNSFGIDGVPTREMDSDFSQDIPADSNLRPVLPTIRKININTRLPQFLEFLTADLLDRR